MVFLRVIAFIDYANRENGILRSAIIRDIQDLYDS